MDGVTAHFTFSSYAPRDGLCGHCHVPGFVMYRHNGISGWVELSLFVQWFSDTISHCKVFIITLQYVSLQPLIFHGKKGKLALLLSYLGNVPASLTINIVYNHRLVTTKTCLGVFFFAVPYRWGCTVVINICHESFKFLLPTKSYISVACVARLVSLVKKTWHTSTRCSMLQTEGPALSKSAVKNRTVKWRGTTVTHNISVATGSTGYSLWLNLSACVYLCFSLLFFPCEAQH